MQVGCQRGGDSGFVVRDWLANGDLSCLVLHSLSLSLSLSLLLGFCNSLFIPHTAAAGRVGQTRRGGAHGCATFF